MTAELSALELAISDVVADPVLYAESFLYVRTKDQDITPFYLNTVQKRLVREKKMALARGKKPRFIVLKARRCGISTWEQAQSFWRVATKSNQHCVTLAHITPSAEILFRTSNLFYEKLPEFVRPRRLTPHNKRDLNFPDLNSLFYIGTAGSRGFGRGDTVARAHWSEVAHSEISAHDQELLLAGLGEAASHGEVVLESSANGIGDLFHARWQEAEAGRSEWTPIFIAWWDDADNARPFPCPDHGGVADFALTLSDEEKDLEKRYRLSGHQLHWRRHKKADLKDLFAQEYPEDSVTVFLVSGMSFFDKLKIAGMLRRLAEPLEIRENGDVVVWKKPEPGRRYVAGADVGEGLAAGDWSIMGVLDLETMEQVAVLRGHWKPEDFARRMDRLGREYNSALLAVERNNHGHSALNTLLNVTMYPNLYYHADYDAAADKPQTVLGWPTNAKTRPIMLDDLRQALEDGLVIARDRVMLTECLTFEQSGEGKYEARGGCHDDAVIAWAIAVQARKNWAQPRVTFL